MKPKIWKRANKHQRETWSCSVNGFSIDKVCKRPVEWVDRDPLGWEARCKVHGPKARKT